MLLISCSGKESGSLPPGAATQSAQRGVESSCGYGTGHSCSGSTSSPTATPTGFPSGAPTASAVVSSGSGGSGKSIYAQVQLTSWYDNNDNASIAYPTLHKQAGGTGTYADPITFGGTTKQFAPGTILYVNYLQKYFIMEDDCGSTCSNAYPKQTIIVLWINGENTSSSSASSCESSLDQSSAAIVLNPSANFVVSSDPLLSSSGKCFQPSAANGYAGGSNGTDSPATPTLPPSIATPTPVPTATPTPIRTATPTPMPTKTATPIPTATPTSAPSACPLMASPTPTPLRATPPPIGDPCSS